MKLASIDIGTNTILLLVAETGRGRIEPLLETETVVGLGKGLQRSGILSADAMNRGLQTLAQYMERCRQMGVQETIAVGTSALRDAGNSREFLNRARRELGLPIEIISGEEEARLSFLAVTQDLKEPEGTLLVVDVGGGSTEFIFGRNNQINRWTSLPLGSVRLTEQFLLSDPVRDEDWDRMEEEVRRLLRTTPDSETVPFMVAVGGTATTLASVEQGLKEFSVEKIHRFVLGKDALARQLSLYRSKTIEERKRIAGLFPNRAEVILAGGAILYVALHRYRCPSVMISCHGIRYGLIYDRMKRR